jgi:soluble lytic murein transglycosylase-like protein
MTKIIMLRLLIHLCGVHHIDPFLAESIIQVESGWDSSVIGLANERGLFQLNPTSFPGINISDLNEPTLNITLGVKYLANMKHNCIHKDNFGYIVCYNRGLLGGSKIKDYKSDLYYNNVMKEYNTLLREAYEN